VSARHPPVISALSLRVSKGKGIFEFIVDRDRDPDGSKLRALLEAQFAYERMRAGRSFCVHILAILGVAVWSDALWPDLLPTEARLFALFLWGGILLLALWCAIQEQVSLRRLKDHRSDDGRAKRSNIAKF
jgi:hypothetical protein